MQRERCECTILEETQRKALLIIPITTLHEITTSMQAAFSPAPPEIDPDRTVETTSGNLAAAAGAHCPPTWRCVVMNSSNNNMTQKWLKK